MVRPYEVATGINGLDMGQDYCQRHGNLHKFVVRNQSKKIFLERIIPKILINISP